MSLNHSQFLFDFSPRFRKNSSKLHKWERLGSKSVSLILIGFLSAPLFSNELLQWISTRCRTVLHKSSDQCRKQYVTCLFAWRTICMTSQCILMTFDCRLHSTDLISVLFTSFYKLYTNMPTFRDLASCQSFRCKIQELHFIYTNCKVKEMVHSWRFMTFQVMQNLWSIRPGPWPSSDTHLPAGGVFSGGRILL